MVLHRTESHHRLSPGPPAHSPLPHSCLLVQLSSSRPALHQTSFLREIMLRLVGNSYSRMSSMKYFTSMFSRLSGLSTRSFSRGKKILYRCCQTLKIKGFSEEKDEIFIQIYFYLKCSKLDKTLQCLCLCLDLEETLAPHYSLVTANKSSEAVTQQDLHTQQTRVRGHYVGEDDR